MSYVKGTRKSKQQQPKSRKFYGLDLSTGLATSLMLALIYLMLTVTAAMESGLDATTLRLTSFVLFAVLAYGARTRLQGMRAFVGLIDVFVLLSLAQLVWDAAAFFGLYDPAKTTGLDWLSTVGFVNLFAAVLLILFYLSQEKSPTSSIWLRPGNYRSGLLVGIPALAGGAIISLATAYVLFNAGSVPSSALAGVLALLATFALADALAGELWFRGMLLSRLLPFVGRQMAYGIQAVVFAVFEAVLVYGFTSSFLYAGAVLLVSAVLALALAEVTVKNNSLLAAVLIHCGVDLVVFLPVFAAFFK